MTANSRKSLAEFISMETAGGLAFDMPQQLNAVKLGVLSGSLVSAFIGLIVLSMAVRNGPAIKGMDS